MKSLPILAIALILVLFAGCEWPEPPLAKPNAGIDPRLIGNWTSNGERKIRLKVASVEDLSYDVILRGGAANRETVMHFRGYHTDLEGIRMVSLELLEVQYPEEMKRLPDGPQHRWLCLGYTTGEDGSLEPRFLARNVLPNGAADRLLVTGQQLYDHLKRYSTSPFHKEHFFDTSTERLVFRKETSRPKE